MSSYFAEKITYCVVIAISFFVLQQIPAQAEGDWVKSHKAKARMIAAPFNEKFHDGSYLVGVQISLEPGWKTYWRRPGDSGIPPEFDWGASQNLKSAKILYPAPKRLADDIGASIVYREEVVFPIIVTPTDKSAPVPLKLSFAYGLCKDICVPAEAELSMTLSPSMTAMATSSAIIDRHLARVPQKHTIGQTETPSIMAVSMKLNSDKPHLEVAAQFTKKAKHQDMFAEVGEEFYIPMPVLKNISADGVATFRIDLSQTDEKEKLIGTPLTLTLVSDKGQSETTVTIK